MKGLKQGYLQLLIDFDILILVRKERDLMLDRTIPYCNVLMRCDRILTKLPDVTLPKGFRFAAYEDGFEGYWAELEADIGDFSSVEEAAHYFRERYLPNREQLAKRCIFLLDNLNRPVATGTAWQDDRHGVPVASLHWLAVKESMQGKGLGKAMLMQVLSRYQELGESPVYLHTQPWSFQAVGLYESCDFHLLKTDSFAGYENQFEKAVELLTPLLSQQIMESLIKNAV